LTGLARGFAPCAAPARHRRRPIPQRFVANHAKLSGGRVTGAILGEGARDEIIDLWVNFEIAQEAKIQVVHAAKVVWTAAAESGRAWRVGGQFIEH